MEACYPVDLDLGRVPTPCFVVDEGLLRRNLSILETVQSRTGCRILLALKGFAMFSLFPLMRETLKGVCASSPHEARLGRELFGKQVHAHAAAFSDADMAELIPLIDHVVFNSISQWHRFRDRVSAAEHPISMGLRVNPESPVGRVPLYDPCGPASRLGIRQKDLETEDLSGIEGLHFHALCEQNTNSLAVVLRAFEAKFGHLLAGMRWVNFGGGHHITRPDYAVDHLCELISGIQSRYAVTVYLEPGEAVALNTGILAASVIDVTPGVNGTANAILDASAATHMPDVLEMPYRPEIVGAGAAGEKAYTYRLGGPSCLAGDIIGDYSFDRPLGVGDKLMFLDMAHYTMVKTNTFNGIRLPSIAVYRPKTDQFEVIRSFGYADFKSRLS
ncbi:MAG: carboxynorspermidine decarboxylase [Deltaproteobacteria bacterium]|nr:MAG: carboxynorspermidine decarboxylase [Deltaproteobacteria bacterium]